MHPEFCLGSLSEITALCADDVTANFCNKTCNICKGGKNYTSRSGRKIFNMFISIVLLLNIIKQCFALFMIFIT